MQYRFGLPIYALLAEESAVGSQNGRAVLSVCDRGPVIAEEARERLFSPFYRVPGKGGAKGTGLGLALVRQIARRHGGEVAYDSERGSCFTVTLPVASKISVLWSRPARRRSAKR